MLINRASIAAVFVGLKATFQGALDATKTRWELTAMLIPSSALSEMHAWLSDFPMMREWIGDKVIKQLKAYGYTLVNKEFETTIGVKRSHLETDTLGIYSPRVRTAGMAAAKWRDQQVNAAKNAAFTATCHDGQYMYDTDHPIGETTFSNKGTAPLSCATQAAAIASLGAAIIALETMVNEEGQPLDLPQELILEVPPALRAVGTVLCENEKLADNSPNPYRGVCKLEVNPGLSSSTSWMVHNVATPIKPYIFQERKPPNFVQQTDASADGVFMRQEFLFGAEASGVAGYGLPQLSYGSTGAG